MGDYFFLIWKDFKVLTRAVPGGQLVNVIALLVYTFSGAIAVIQTKISNLDNVLKNKLKSRYGQYSIKNCFAIRQVLKILYRQNYCSIDT